MYKVYKFTILLSAVLIFSSGTHVYEPVKFFEGPSQDVEALAFTPDGERLFAGGWDNEVFIFEWPTGNLLNRFNAHQSAIISIQFSQDGDYFMTASNDNTAKLWRTRDLEHIHTYSDHSRPVRSAAISPDNRFVLTASEDRSINIYDRENDNEKVRTIQLNNEEGRHVSFEPNRGFILKATSGNNVEMLQPGNLNLLREFQHQGGVNEAYFTPDGKHLATASDDRTAAIWNPVQGDKITSLEGHTWRVLSVHLDSNAEYAVTSSNDGTARLWDVKTSEALKIFEPSPRTIIRSVLLSPDLDYVITSGQMRQPDHKPIMIWESDINSEEEIEEPEEGLESEENESAGDSKEQAGNEDVNIEDGDIDEADVEIDID